MCLKLQNYLPGDMYMIGSKKVRFAIYSFYFILSALLELAISNVPLDDVFHF